ncbi:hypothetical protein CC78DRAFT_571262 [Lojkania enalia]|uniref:UbiA prenyltransferase n=1 Tax=Lojkania enalia TaxID=147567 RepID=A0A9P4MZJ3_9PLEO|nr:hypothetical protein CC78DRAFT_571262 [Didymosphaeria enalia]
MVYPIFKRALATLTPLRSSVKNWLIAPFSVIRAILYHFHTLILFTYDQIFDIIAPFTVFAISAALSGPTLNLPSRHPSNTLSNLPLAVFWLWLMVLQFCLHNQRHPHSIQEDAINKPWRPLPAKRISAKQTIRLLEAVDIINAILSYYLGVEVHMVVYTVLVLAYNDFGGSDFSGFSRNLLNAGGFACFASCALQVAIGSESKVSAEAWQWTAAIVLALFTTTHAQEFRDEKGDSERGRSTMITTLGQVPARWSLIIPVLAWSVGLPMWMGVGWKGSLAPKILAVVVSWMTLKGLKEKDERVDRRMYRIWALWAVSLCPLPLMKALGT